VGKGNGRKASVDQKMFDCVKMLLAAALAFCIISYALYKSNKTWAEEYPMTN